MLKSAKRRLDTQRAIINHFSRLLPTFNELFDERSWYIFFACLALASFFVAFIISRCVTVYDADYDFKDRRRSARFSGVKRTRLL